MFGAGTTALIICNEEMNGIVKIVKSLDECGLLIKFVRNKTEGFKVCY